MKIAPAAAWIVWMWFPAASCGTFEFSRPIEDPKSPREELLEIVLDRAIYAGTGTGFRDLRLVDGEGIETPYLIDKLRSARHQSVRKYLDARIISLKQFENHAIELQLGLNTESPPAEGLSILTPLSNFEHRVQVFGSADGSNWEALVEDAVIYDYSRFIDLNSREIPLPSNTFRQLKVRVEEPVKSYESESFELTREVAQGQEQASRERMKIRRVPLRIDRIRYWYSQVVSKPAADALRDYPVTGFRVDQDGSTRTTLVEISMQREPLTGFTIQTASRNFSRRARVEVPPQERGGAGEWREIARASLERVNYRALHHEDLRIVFPEHRHKQYRIVIRNENNPALEVTGVQGHGNSYRLLFFAEPGKIYSLNYGDHAADAPVYDTASLEAALAASYEPIRAALGPETAAAKSEKPFAFEFSRWINSDLFLGGAVFIAVTVLAVALVYAARRIDSPPED